VSISVDVTQPADFPVNQVLAFTGSVQPARHLDVAREQRGRHGDVPVAVAIPVAVPVAIPVAVAATLAVRRTELDERGLVVLRRGVQPGQPQADFSGRARLARVAAAEDDVLHLVAAQALGALLAEHPGDGVRHVALATAVRADDGRDAMVESQLCPVGKRLESVDVKAF
jgi:hypothetical protein